MSDWLASYYDPKQQNDAYMMSAIKDWLKTQNQVVSTQPNQQGVQKQQDPSIVTNVDNTQKTYNQQFDGAQVGAPQINLNGLPGMTFSPPTQQTQQQTQQQTATPPPATTGTTTASTTQSVNGSTSQLPSTHTGNNSTGLNSTGMGGAWNGNQSTNQPNSSGFTNPFGPGRQTGSGLGAGGATVWGA